jgi:hypothetical protein
VLLSEFAQPIEEISDKLISSWVPMLKYNKNMQGEAFEAIVNLSILNYFLVFQNLIFLLEA